MYWYVLKAQLDEAVYYGQRSIWAAGVWFKDAAQISEKMVRMRFCHYADSRHLYR